ncbi:hypothetical protein CEK28_09660 [Xenophilus sp. AP218F]|nr:DUF3426 domain-containing protein [Chromobacterium sp. ASV5]OWY39136.1 hypothetical protein CEK28_09660 [Xenophilus sp. AP218F]
MTYTTQCPNCQTRFKVNDAQLAAANGLVRCGRCSHVFKAPDHFVAAPQAQPPVAPRPAPSAMPAPASRQEPDDFELEVPDFDPRDSAPPAAPAMEFEAPRPSYAAAETSTPAAEDHSAEAEAFQRALAEAMQNRHVSAPIGNPFEEPEPMAQPAAAPQAEPEVFGSRRRAEVPPAETPSEPIFAEKPHPRPPQEPLPSTDDGLDDAPPRRNPLLTGLFAALSVLGILLLIGQLVFINRTRIAAEVPESRPALEAMCQAMGCKVPWPTDIALIRTEWSELAFVPDHPNLIQLSATLKNHAPFAQAYPMLEVTLKDADDQVLIRKVFAPKEYLKPDDAKRDHFNANSELKITMRLDAGKVHAMGYSLYWFYP